MTQLDAMLQLGPAAVEIPEPREGSSTVSAVEFGPLGAATPSSPAAGIDLLSDVTIEISVELGRATLLVRDVLALKVGSVVEVNKLAGEPGDVFVNGTMVARGEIVVVDDRFGIRIFEVVAHSRLTQGGR